MSVPAPPKMSMFPPVVVREDQLTFTLPESPMAEIAPPEMLASEISTL